MEAKVAHRMTTVNHTTGLMANEGDTHLHSTFFFVSCKPDWTTAGQHAGENKESSTAAMFLR